ncbi:hypothetical protein K469DRAFT_655012 [Zopfia rhizophila CBS 207.26]|uniref:Heterokaryon incompatibility domain-containing protein n=1 Tax=Zopfia rhizophila CBS 207.26 TaxID=1314779 RepID=A0A6A6EM80_9PEZI|nr:hypothetical protein K469DRAFT_655012 [Zopfia rhizophila CBS 207.26]
MWILCFVIFWKKAITRLLWIDAICLNQNDHTKKSHQVQLMGDMYSQALKVHIWLDDAEEDDGLPQLFIFFQAIAAASGRTIPPVGQLTDLVTHAFGSGSRGPALPRFLFRSLCRPYCNCRWVLQEAILGHHVTARCGSIKVAWKCLVNGMIPFNQLNQSISTLENVCITSTFDVSALRSEPDDMLYLL